MAATPLTSGPVMGVLTPSGSSPVFTLAAKQFAILVVGMSRLASTATPQLLRSPDGGQTWTPTPLPLLSPGRFLSPTDVPVWQSSQFYSALPYNETAAAVDYRIDAAFASGSMFYCARTNQINFRTAVANLIEPGDVMGSKLGVTTSQLLNLHTTALTPLTDSQVVPPLTLYKQCQNCAIAKVQVPSDALVAIDKNLSFVNGEKRIVRASKVQVLSIMDATGAPVLSARSMLDKTTTYTVGDTVNFHDVGLVPGTGITDTCNIGSFDAATFRAGIYGLTTLLEAACQTGYPVDLAALGL